MAKIVDNILKISNPTAHICDILTTRCKLHVGDQLCIGCWGLWDDDPRTPMVGAWIKLRFYDGSQYNVYEDRWLGQTNSDGWYGGYYTITEDDLLNPCGFGYVQLVAHSDPVGYGFIHDITFDCLYSEQSVGVVESIWPYNDIEGATVTCTGKPSCTTDSEGECLFTGLDPDTEYTFEASKEGHKCYACTHTTKPGVHFGLWLTPPTPVCTQYFRVYHPDGSPAIGAEVRINSTLNTTIYCGSTNECSLELVEGQSYTMFARKTGYLNSDEYTISSACEGVIALLLKKEVVTCEYTGYASDAKIDHDDVPSSAAKGNEVTGSVSVDCIEGGETRYRVKFVLDGGSPVYSDSFLLGYVGEMDVLFTFIMPDHDVTLIAEVERCNASGEWEPCEHADHIKTYTVTLTLYEGPYGVIAEGYPKISNESCLDTCENANPCTADEGDRPDFEVVYKNAGNEDGYFQAFLIGYNGIGIDAPDAPEGEGKVFDSEFHVLPTSFKLGPGESRTVTLTPKLLCGSMPDTDWDLGIKIARITSLGFFKEWNDTKSFKVCYKHVVDHYSLALNDLPDELHTGDKITFSGKLSHDAGGVVNNKLIEIMEKDIDPDDFIAKGTTNPDGSFTIPWTVKKVGGWLEGKTAEFYARFKFDSKEVTSNTERVVIVGPSLTKALVYGGIAVAAFAGGSIAESVAGPKGKMIGVPVKLGALIPAGLCGYQTYLIAKDKVPEWLKG